MCKKIILITILLVIISTLIAENVLLEITPSNMVYNYFYPAYIDPANPEMQPFLFRLRAVNNGNDAVSNYQIQLRLQWRDQMLIDNLLVEPKTGSQYEIIPAGGEFNISSQQLIVSEESQNFSAIDGIDFDDIMDSNQEFQDLILQLGYFPDGDYVFTAQMYEGNDPLSNPVTFTFSIIAPTAVTLISPGNPIGLGPSVMSDYYPYFVWFSNLNHFEFLLYELQGGEESDEEIENQSELIYENKDIDNVLVFSYPSTAPGLQENKLYAWQIKAQVTSPLAESDQAIKSNLYLFSISTDSEVNQNNQMLINFLEQIQIEGMDQIISLLEQGYDFDSINWQGNDMGIDGLNDLLQRIVNGEIEVTNMTIE